MERYPIRIGETIGTIIIEPQYLPITEEAVREVRREIMAYIDRDPIFKISHMPMAVHENAPDVVQHMAEMAQKAGVGPMAAVAGAIAQYVTEELIDVGADHVVFDNGGDIAMYLAQPAVVGLYTGLRGLNRLGFRVTQLDTVLGLCTSSGTVGHSFSYGNTDASMVFSDDVALADASATALGNMVTREDSGVVEDSLRTIMNYGIRGAMVVIGDVIGTCGELPELVLAHVDHELISRG